MQRQRLPINEEKLAGPGHFREINPMVTRQMDEAAKIAELREKIMAGQDPHAKAIAGSADRFIVRAARPDGFDIEYGGEDMGGFSKAVDALAPGKNSITPARPDIAEAEMRGDEMLTAKRKLLERISVD